MISKFVLKWIRYFSRKDYQNLCESIVIYSMVDPVKLCMALTSAAYLYFEFCDCVSLIHLRNIVPTLTSYTYKPYY